MGKKTAVQWMVDEFYKFENGHSEYPSKIAIINEALKIEKQNIIDAWLDGLSKDDIQKLVAELYYKQTYGTTDGS